MRMGLRLALAGAAMVTCASVVVSNARADSFSFNLTNGNSGINANAGPYASVMVNRTDSTDATITFTGLSNSTVQYLLGGNGAVGIDVSGTFNLVTSGVNAPNGTVAFSSVTNQGLSDGGSTNEDGFGSFNDTIDAKGGYTQSFTQIVISIVATGATTWANAASVLTDAAAHIFVCTSPCTPSAGALSTGFAEGTSVGIQQVPGPVLGAGLPSLIAALGGLVALARRRRRQLAA